MHNFRFRAVNLVSFKFLTICLLITSTIICVSCSVGTSGVDNQPISTNTKTLEMQIRTTNISAILSSTNIPIINTLNTLNGSMLVTNIGNSIATNINESLPVGVTLSSGIGACTSTLVSHASCTLYFSVPIGNGSGSFVINYNDGVLSKPINWYNPKSGLIVQMSANPSFFNFPDGSSESAVVILVNQSPYTLINIIESFTNISGSANLIISSNTCNNLLPYSSCSFIVNIIDAIPEINQQLNVSISGIFNNGSIVSYSRSLPMLYSAVYYAYIWLNGGSNGMEAGVYGTLGVKTATNMPGARGYGMSWMNTSNNTLWHFGGAGYDSSSTWGYLNDLWKYDESSNQWVWMSGSNLNGQKGIYGTKGVSTSITVPGARYSGVQWIDSVGNLWLLGGIGYDSAGSTGYLNDLWVYNLGSKQWKWVNGANVISQNGVYGTKGVFSQTNTPGSRNYAISWVDSFGKFWLFGGFGYDSVGATGYLNDLWAYDPLSNQWAWINGANIIAQKGIYGTQGVSSAINIPGSRDSEVVFVDSNQKVWIFGGYGYDSVGNRGYLNDLWQYSPATNQWMWVNGANIINQRGVYGAQGVSSATNVPGGRYGSSSWIDSLNNLWLVSGYGYASVGSSGYLNDLWEYNTTANQWVWVNGSNALNPLGVWGNKGTLSILNALSGRFGSVFWLSTNGNFWIFGGYGYNSNGTISYLSDMWKHPLK